MDTKSRSSTIPSLESGMDRWERWLRLISLALIGGVVLAAATGLLGVRTGKVTATGGGYTITVWYAEVARPGLATPFSVEVRPVTGTLPASVTVRVSSPFLALFDDNGMEPAPAESFNTPEWTWWTFDVPPDTDVLRVDLDARLEPAVQIGQNAMAAVEIDDQQMVSVAFTMSVAP